MSRAIPAPLLVIVAAVLAFALLREPAPESASPSINAEDPRYVLRGTEWRSFDADGEVRFEGRARLIDYYDDESARMRDFQVRIPGREDRAWVAWAPLGQLPAGGRERLHLSGGVEGQGSWPDGLALTFSTPELWVDAGNESLDTTAEVQVNSVGRSGRSVGMKVDGPAHSVRLLADVEIRYVPG